METLVPNFFVHDMSATIAFYTTLGFNITMSVPDKPPYTWVNMTNGNISVMFQTFESLGSDLPDVKRVNGGSLILYIRMKNIRTYYERIKGKAVIVQELHKTFYGATEFAIKDCNEYILTFAEDE